MPRKITPEQRAAMIRGKRAAAKKRAAGLLPPYANRKAEVPATASQVVAIYITKAYRCIKDKPIEQLDEAHLNIFHAYRELHRK